MATSIKDKIFIASQHIVPQHLLSRLVGWVAETKISWIKNLFISKFIKAFNVNMDEAQRQTPEAFENFNDFFTRELKPGMRPIAEENNAIACPADGAISQLGPIENGRVFQAKGHDYSLIELLGGEAETAEPFMGGQFATIYLSPKDYHRIHFPIGGTLKKMVHVPGDLFSVNPTTVAAIDELFARNERVIAFFDTPAGPMAMVMVGAIFVSSIETVWYGEVTPPRHNQIRHWSYQDKKLKYKKNEEMARFNMGSTVVLLYGKDKVTWAEGLAAGDTVQHGQVIAKMNKQ